MYDATEQMVFDSELAAGVLGRGEDFVLIPLDGPHDDATMKDAQARGFSYCGALGVINGQAACVCEPRPDAAFTMLHAALAFAQQVAERLRPRPKGDAVAWLEALYALPDMRAT